MTRIEFLKTIFTELNTKDINYCVLRNYDFLIEEREPQHASESGIDMSVSVQDFPEFKQLLSQHGFILAKQSFSKKHYNFIALHEMQLISFDVQLGGVHWNDIAYLSDELFKHKQKKAFFYVPSDNDTFVMLLAHSILGKRKFKLEYRKIILSLMNKVDKDYVRSQLTTIFGIKNTNKLLKFLQQARFEKIIKIRYDFMMYFLLKNPQKIFPFIALFFRWLCLKKLHRTYPLITIVGPDGSGKSSLTQNMIEFLQQQHRKVHFVYNGRGRDHILPITKVGYRYKVKEIKQDANVKSSTKTQKEKQQKSKSNLKRKLLYTLTAPIFTLDLVLRYLVRIFPRRHQKKIVVTDRYCSDIILMKHVPFWFKRILLALFPTPIINIYLYNTPEELHKRRPEETVTELQRQMSIFDKFDYSLKAKTTNKEQDTQRILKFVLFNLYKKGF